MGSMGLPLAPPEPLVDFAKLPVLQLPSSLPAEQPVYDSAGEGIALEAAPDDDAYLEEDPQEELGDSTLEAQARGWSSLNSFIPITLCSRHQVLSNDI
jgi:hypothetical protein